MRVMMMVIDIQGTRLGYDGPKGIYGTYLSLIFDI